MFKVLFRILPVGTEETHEHYAGKIVCVASKLQTGWTLPKYKAEVLLTEPN